MSPDAAPFVPKEKAIALLSGGLDSTVSLADGLECYDVILALTFNYGQRAFGKEIRASRRIAEHYGVTHQVIPLPWLSELLPQPLSLRRGGMDAVYPSAWRTGDEDTPGFFDAKPVWVPNRNGLFLNIAAVHAEALEAQVILFGANAEEAANFPDNSEAFRERVNAALELSTLTHPRVECPMGRLDKAQIVERAVALNVPLQHIWSCYSDMETQCGQCPSCYRLRQALKKAPTGAVYRDKVSFHR